MKQLLSIDDEPASLQCIAAALRSQGYELIVTSDPDEGLRILHERQDIVLALLDVCMPKKNGFDIYKDLRTFKKIPVLFVTALPDAFNAESPEVNRLWSEEFADGTTDIIYKPFDAPTLLQKVEGLIGTPAELERDS
jgi:CheY-like chemotaxis protein